MPYHKVKDHSECNSGEIAVVKDATGEVMGCHESEAKADRQLAALHAAEGTEADSTDSALISRYMQQNRTP